MGARARGRPDPSRLCSTPCRLSHSRGLCPLAACSPAQCLSCVSLCRVRYALSLKAWAVPLERRNRKVIRLGRSVSFSVSSRQIFESVCSVPPSQPRDREIRVSAVTWRPRPPLTSGRGSDGVRTLGQSLPSPQTPILAPGCHPFSAARASPARHYCYLNLNLSCLLQTRHEKEVFCVHTCSP